MFHDTESSIATVEEDAGIQAQANSLETAPLAQRKRYTSVGFSIVDVHYTDSSYKDNPLLAWVKHWDTFLEELFRLEGRGDERSCRWCGHADDLYRCSDCGTVNLSCGGCTVSNHHLNPLHSIKKWNGAFFERDSLINIGLRIQLGHNANETCRLPVKKDNFMVIDCHGIQTVAVDFCGCETAQTPVRQLLRFRWFPATVSEPSTVATFRVLEQFQLLSFESKVSTYEFYHSISRRSDNTGVYVLKDRYTQFLRIIREWRHLKLLKHAGCPYDCSGDAMTALGSCAIVCPACPQPGRNMPDDLSQVSPDKRWLYALFVSVDADFRMKRKDVSSDAADPGLNNGCAYFVEEGNYKSHISNRKDEVQEKSDCTGHTAVNLADTKPSRGLAATGIGAVDCARHGFKLPNAVGDLQKGERYINMDYLFFSVLSKTPARKIFISYDIACQWNKKLWTRMDTLPPSMHADQASKDLDFVVPKFHLNAHKLACQISYSLNLLPGVGRTDGEGVERGWANINPAASSTKQMGPGSRRDTLDDYFGDWNWKKLVGLGALLSKKTKEAMKECTIHHAALTELETSIPTERLSVWRSEVMAWELDRKQPNPYAIRVEAPTTAKISLQLAEAEAAEQKAGPSSALHSDVSATQLIILGLDLEEQQRRLAAEASKLGSDATDSQRAKIQHNKNGLQRKVSNWRSIQLLYMPGVSWLQASEDEPDDITKVKLWLPSQVPRTTMVDPRLHQYEFKLRHAQALDALEEIRKHIRLRAYLLTFNRSNIRGQGANTRARSMLDGVEGKIHTCSIRYRVAQAAVGSLAGILGIVGWENIFRPLKDDDLRAAEDPSASLMIASEGRRQLSWIYTTIGASETEDSGMQDCT
ncbi:hypothetical protein L210DRAFT_3421490 [Boletus edulis BED1]|uniref:CxC2-like cysteine cluster KDZ transposase-associated domain-containing protein n=1 Tax=Boletus edulis BED1 TaxID=1328754 RepID=A0AAD4G7E5_BOLED|nr:hypothetical protein L210DRAFT_3421490 [Boletus edulis BED1]